MVSFDQFLDVLRDRLLEFKGTEVTLGPYMLTASLVMNNTDWQYFAKAMYDRLQLDIDMRALTGSSTILDLYFASVYRFQLAPIRAMTAPCIAIDHANSRSNQTAYLH